MEQVEDAGQQGLAIAKFFIFNYPDLLIISLERATTVLIVKLVMGGVLFMLGLFTAISGLYIILRKEYQEALKTLTSQSPKLVSKSPVEELVVPLAQSSIQLMETVNRLIQTAVGVGAFLCMLGSALCIAAYWMISN